MKKIGVITCRKDGLTCTAAGCFKVFNEKSKHFDCYKGEDIQMSAFFDCSGCDADKKTDAGFLKKMTRLKENDIMGKTEIPANPLTTVLNFSITVL